VPRGGLRGKTDWGFQKDQPPWAKGQNETNQSESRVWERGLQSWGVGGELLVGVNKGHEAGEEGQEVPATS